ncbi:MAG: hypothetical protein WA655_22810 [Candidatus Korobacteraceae bacterium]
MRGGAGAWFHCVSYTFRPVTASYLSHMRPPGLGKCANPDCKAEFKRLGTGKIYTLPVRRPLAWGLPANVKQKVIWLCSKCAMTKEVQFDQEHYQVLVVGRHRAQGLTA